MPPMANTRVSCSGKQDHLVGRNDCRDVLLREPPTDVRFLFL